MGKTLNDLLEAATLRSMVGVSFGIAAGLQTYRVIEEITNYVSNLNQMEGLREAVYQKAAEITPEVIERANILAESVNNGNLSSIIFPLAFLSANITLAYCFLKRPSSELPFNNKIFLGYCDSKPSSDEKPETISN